MPLRLESLCLAALVLLVPSAFAITLHGVVTDKNTHESIANVVVTISGAGASAPATTDSDGSFRLELSVNPNTPITLVFQKPDYASFTLHDVATDQKDFLVSLVPSKQPSAAGAPVNGQGKIITDPASYYAAQLKSSDTEACLGAAHSIARFQLNTPAVVDALIFALQDKNIQVRIEAAKTLGEIKVKGPKPVPSLIVALENVDSAELRSASAETLGLIGAGARSAVGVLRQSLSDDNDAVREKSALALAAIDPASDQPAVEVLCGLLGRQWTSYNDNGDSSKILDLVLKGHCSSDCVQGIARNIGSSASEPEAQQTRELRFVVLYGPAGRQALLKRLLAVDGDQRDKLVALMGSAADHAFREDLQRVLLHTLDNEASYNEKADPIHAAEQLNTLDATAHEEIAGVLMAAYKHRESAKGPVSQKRLAQELVKFPPEGTAFLLDDLQNGLSAKKLWLVDVTAPLPGAALLEQPALQAALSRAAELSEKVSIAGKLLATAPKSDDPIPILAQALASKEEGPRENAVSIIQANQKSLSVAGAQQIISALVKYIDDGHCSADGLTDHTDCSEKKLLLSFGDTAVLALAEDFRGHQSYWSAQLLVEMGTDARLAVPAMIQAIQENPKDFSMLDLSLDVLRGVGPDAAPAVPVIIPLLEFKDSNNVIQDDAANTLKAIGPGAQSSLPALTRYAARRHRQETWDSIKGAMKDALNQ
jgi:hypothetical protein